MAVLLRRRTTRPSILNPAPSTFRLQPLTRRYLLGLGCWALICIGATDAWYRFRDRDGEMAPRWSAVLPTNNPSFKKIELPPRSVRLLRHDSGATGSWAEDDGSEWSASYLRWNSTSATSIFRARQHRPDVCLPAAGLSLVQDAGLERVQARHFVLPFRKYVYQSAGKRIYVFFCQWEDRAKRQSGLADTEQGGRIKAAWDGHRTLGQQSLELILTGYGSLADAEQAVRKKLPALIVPQLPASRAG